MNTFRNRRRREVTKRRTGAEQPGALTRIDKSMKELVFIQNEVNKSRPPIVHDIPMPFLAKKVYTFSRSVFLGTLAATTVVDTTFNPTFTLGAFPNSTEFTTLFDEYRIGPTTVTFTPLGGAAGVVNSFFATVLDYDDANVIALTDAEQYSSYQINQLTSMFIRVFQPRAANAAYSGTFTSFSSMPARSWVDVASPNVQYYGIKGVIPASSISGGPFSVYSVTATSILQFRYTR